MGGAETQGCRPLGHQHRRNPPPQAAPPGPLPPSAIGHTLSRRWQREGGSPTCGRHGPGLALPVRSGDTHVPSAGMTKTPACVVHLPGKEKRG